MACASCGRTAKAGARFCVGCGASLPPHCPACGASLAPGSAEGGAARKVVTIVFADPIGSTALQERLDPESVSRIMEGYQAAVRAPPRRRTVRERQRRRGPDRAYARFAELCADA